MNSITAEDLQGLNHKQQVMFAVFCTKQVEHLITSEEAKRCLEVTELWLEGKATAEECSDAYYTYYAADAARVAARDADAAYAAYAGWAAAAATRAADVARAAGAAARAAVWAANAAADNRQELLKQQRQYLYELKNIDKILEEELLI